MLANSRLSERERRTIVAQRLAYWHFLRRQRRLRWPVCAAVVFLIASAVAQCQRAGAQPAVPASGVCAPADVNRDGKVSFADITAVMVALNDHAPPDLPEQSADARLAALRSALCLIGGGTGSKCADDQPAAVALFTLPAERVGALIGAPERVRGFLGFLPEPTDDPEPAGVDADAPRAFPSSTPPQEPRP